MPDTYPATRRLNEAVAGMLGALDDEQRASILALAELGGPEDAVPVVAYDRDADAFVVSWTGAVIGVVSRRWLLTGEVPDGFGPDDDG